VQLPPLRVWHLEGAAATRPGVPPERFSRQVGEGAADPPAKTLWWYAWPRGGGPLQVPNSQWWQLHNFGTSSLSILLCLGGGEGGPRSGNMGAAGFGATVSGAPPPQTIVWWWGAGGTMEGPLEEANLVRAPIASTKKAQVGGSERVTSRAGFVVRFVAQSYHKRTGCIAHRDSQTRLVSLRIRAKTRSLF